MVKLFKKNVKLEVYILKIADILTEVNTNNASVSSIYERLNIGKDTYGRTIAISGLTYDNKAKLYNVTDQDVYNQTQNLTFEQLNNIRLNKNEQPSKKPPVKKQKVQEEAVKIPASDFTENEVVKLRKLVEVNDLSLELALLPERKKTKKVTLEIDEELLEGLQEIVNSHGRINQTTAIEIAINQLIRRRRS